MTARDRASAHPRPPTLAEIIGAVAAVTGVSVDAMKMASNAKRSSRARFHVAALAREFTGKSYPQIGAALGGRDHSTIISATLRAHALVQTDPEFAAEHALIRMQIAGAPDGTTPAEQWVTGYRAGRAAALHARLLIHDTPAEHPEPVPGPIRVLPGGSAPPDRCEGPDMLHAMKEAGRERFTAHLVDWLRREWPEAERIIGRFGDHLAWTGSSFAGHRNGEYLRAFVERAGELWNVHLVHEDRRRLLALIHSVPPEISERAEADAQETAP